MFVFLLTHLVSTTHPLFQVTDNMSSSVGAEDSRAGRPPGDKREAPSDSNKCPAEGANAASASYPCNCNRSRNVTVIVIVILVIIAIIFVIIIVIVAVAIAEAVAVAVAVAVVVVVAVVVAVAGDGVFYILILYSILYYFLYSIL